MQTFLPYSDFKTSAQCLDRQRLGKQRVEALQILRTLTGVSKGWTNHPAAKMWSGHVVALGLYGLVMCQEWVRRGYKDTCIEKIQEIVTPYNYGPATYPTWLGNEDFHLSHRSNLVRKLPEHYGPLWPDVPNDLPYIWPV